jgi:hypothetical protein
MTLLKELGYNFTTMQPVGNDTYSPTQLTTEQIINSQIDLQKEEFGVSCDDSN